MARIFSPIWNEDFCSNPLISLSLCGKYYDWAKSFTFLVVQSYLPVSVPYGLFKITYIMEYIAQITGILQNCLNSYWLSETYAYCNCIFVLIDYIRMQTAISYQPRIDTEPKVLILRLPLLAIKITLNLISKMSPLSGLSKRQQIVFMVVNISL